MRVVGAHGNARLHQIGGVCLRQCGRYLVQELNVLSGGEFLKPSPATSISFKRLRAGRALIRTSQPDRLNFFKGKFLIDTAQQPACYLPPLFGLFGFWQTTHGEF